MKITIKSLALLACLFSGSLSAQRPYEFKCTDYIATPDRSQAKFSYDEEANTFTINDTGTNNIAFLMDKKADYAYYITNEQPIVAANPKIVLFMS